MGSINVFKTTKNKKSFSYFNNNKQESLDFTENILSIEDLLKIIRHWFE